MVRACSLQVSVPWVISSGSRAKAIFVTVGISCGVNSIGAAIVTELYRL
jgi:hypothetical protein